jgi:hypothetical protein
MDAYDEVTAKWELKVVDCLTDVEFKEINNVLNDVSVNSETAGWKEYYANYFKTNDPVKGYIHDGITAILGKSRVESLERYLI